MDRHILCIGVYWLLFKFSKFSRGSINLVFAFLFSAWYHNNSVEVIGGLNNILVPALGDIFSFFFVLCL